MQRSEYVERWSSSHGYEARRNALVEHWLNLVYRLARPLAAGNVSPHLLSLVGAGAAAGAAVLATLPPRWAIAAAGVVVVTGILDGLDGAVAVLRDRVTPVGAVVDACADRVGDVLFVTSLWAAGAPAVPCVVGAALMLLHEYVRARARGAGLSDVGVITVWERPTRVVVTAAFLFAYGLYAEPVWPLLGAAVWVVLGVVGVVQLVLVVRRRLS